MSDSTADIALPPSPVPNALEYAPSPNRRRRRIRRIVLLLLLAAAAVAGWRWGPAIWTRAALLYHQRKCMTYAPSADQVVFDTDPARVAQWASDKNFLVVGGCAYRKSPADWEAMNLATVGTPSVATPRRALVFLHERRSPNGTARLVAVERTTGLNESAYFMAGYDVEVTVIEPAGLHNMPRVIPEMWAIDVLDGIGPHTDIRIFAGQPDPADASRFTIRYESRGMTNTVDGVLKDDGRVELVARPFPEK